MKYISVLEYLMGRAELYSLPKDIIGNINTIVPKANELLEKFGSYRKVNSGYRTLEDQLRINPKSPKSKHTIGGAVDLEDADGKLNLFCKNNEKLLVELGLWCEERQGGWQHIQIFAPSSSKRWFKP